MSIRSANSESVAELVELEIQLPVHANIQIETNNSGLISRNDWTMADRCEIWTTTSLTLDAERLSSILSTPIDVVNV